MILHLRAAVQQLYAAPPTRFTPLRSELVAEAKLAGDPDLAKSIGGLRKPTVAAWAVNHFVRQGGEAMEDFRAFALLLREAQRTLDADQLRLLGRERARRVDELAERIEAAAAEAGHPLGAAAGGEVRETLTAFIADEEAERSVLTGSLVRALAYSGFGSVELDNVLAIEPSEEEQEAPGGTTETIDLAERRRARAAAERARLEAAVDRARRALEGAEHHVEILAARQEEASAGIADLERQLATARRRLEKVTAEHDEASGIRDSLRGDLDEARAALQRHDEG